jgi:hypothetical protein
MKQIKSIIIFVFLIFFLVFFTSCDLSEFAPQETNSKQNSKQNEFDENKVNNIFFSYLYENEILFKSNVEIYFEYLDGELIDFFVIEVPYFEDEFLFKVPQNCIPTKRENLFFYFGNNQELFCSVIDINKNNNCLEHKSNIDFIGKKVGESLFDLTKKGLLYKDITDSDFKDLMTQNGFENLLNLRINSVNFIKSTNFRIESNVCNNAFNHLLKISK